ncbi:hypothetical protein RHGRI_014226 [Rhododendron griersonianum]|uniref:Uncharacterized protein n=1 Tax=Rhododendron griersonianum TaxID=479676 RepID=A0AAV6K8K0_9ERIC|nr:hypothetical protein RHGRI_014226 [Rhododendron griersonianum]
MTKIAIIGAKDPPLVATKSTTTERRIIQGTPFGQQNPRFTLLKDAQTKVEMVLEQLVSSPFTDAVKHAQPPKNFTAPKFNTTRKLGMRSPT